MSGSPSTELRLGSQKQKRQSSKVPRWGEELLRKKILPAYFCSWCTVPESGQWWQCLDPSCARSVNHLSDSQELNYSYCIIELILWANFLSWPALLPSPQPQCVTEKDINVLSPGRACWSALNRSCRKYLVGRREVVGKWSHLNWHPWGLWEQAGSEQPGSAPKATSFILEKPRPVVTTARAAFTVTIPAHICSLCTLFQTWFVIVSRRSMLTRY